MIRVKVGENGFTPYGTACDFFYCKDPEIMLSGPAETGKTITALHKLHLLCCKYKNVHAVMVRKTQKSIYASAVKTFQEKVLGKDTPVDPYGGKKPEWFDYPNGSRIVVAGLDNPGKVLSAEYDLAYVNQAEELTANDWETLTTRTTGRAGHMPYAQVMGDCNPGGRTHWILEREKADSLRRFNTRHQDNPVLFNQENGEITEQGKRSLHVLNQLTGLRRARLLEGKWVSAEGQIYTSYNPDVHLINRFDIPADWRRIRVIDFGYTNPFVCGWWAIDGDGRLYLYRQIYMTGRTVSRHAKQIKELSEGERIDSTICDHDAEDRATLLQEGIPNIPAQKDVGVGIQKVEDRLKVQDDGRPRIFILRDSLVETDETLVEKHLPTCAEDEIDGYVWADKSRKEEPVKENDHGCDMMRYAVMHLDKRRGWARGAS